MRRTGLPLGEELEPKRSSAPGRVSLRRMGQANRLNLHRYKNMGFLNLCGTDATRLYKQAGSRFSHVVTEIKYLLQSIKW